MPVRRLADALDRCDRTLERLDDLGHRDLLGGTREEVAPVGAAPAFDQPRLAQAGGQVLEIGEWQAVAVGDLAERYALAVAVGAVPRQLDHYAHAVLGSGGEHHRKTDLEARVSAVSPASGGFAINDGHRERVLEGGGMHNAAPPLGPGWVWGVMHRGDA